MTNREKCEMWLDDPNTPKCAWMKKTFPKIDKCAGSNHACKEIPKIIAKRSNIPEPQVRTIRNVMHYVFKLQKPILCALAEVETDGLRAEEVWRKIGVNDKFLCDEKKECFVKLTRSLLCMMEVEEHLEKQDGAIWKITDKGEKYLERLKKKN